MKQLLFAGSFAILSFIAYGVNTGTDNFSGKHGQFSFQNFNDTTPRLDTTPKMKKKKYGGKDSLLRRDSLNPVKDTTHH